MVSTTPFSEFLQEFRDHQRLPLRKFCQKYGLDPSTHSKMERAMRKPPQSRDALEKLARQLQIEEGAEEWKHFMEIAEISAGLIPRDVLSDKEIAPTLPLLFRTIRGEKLNREQMEELVELLRRN